MATTEVLMDWGTSHEKYMGPPVQRKGPKARKVAITNIFGPQSPFVIFCPECPSFINSHQALKISAQSVQYSGNGLRITLTWVRIPLNVL